jgi:hypothetical protein
VSNSRSSQTTPIPTEFEVNSGQLNTQPKVLMDKVTYRLEHGEKNMKLTSTNIKLKKQEMSRN